MDPNVIQPRQQTTAATTTGSSATSASASATTSQFTLPANAAPGQIVFTQPPLQSTSYYKIASGEYITFGWNFTGLYVSAACENGNTYPVGPSNGVIPGNAQSVVWYPYGYQTANPSLPLAQATYTLQIWGDQGPSAAPTAGYLEANSELQFALYTPQPYTPLASGWQCTGCGGALAQLLSSILRPSLFVTTLLVVFLSGFTTVAESLDMKNST
ncbi:hypothetical protein BKA82DRAFT_4447421 [Pisolithus tinctorius]|nr:hypothetical protein BKA82DRAFT_4447421 [Pisolithus tinctorius]